MSNVRTTSGIPEQGSRWSFRKAVAGQLTANASIHNKIFVPLLVVTLVSTFSLIIIGGIVRVTDSGLGCPGWPLCYGKVIPPMEKHAVIEYSHRFFASIVSALIIAVATLSWAYYRRYKTILYLGQSIFLLLVLQVMLGGLTVKADLASEFVTAHLATAESLLAVLGFLTMYAILAGRTPPRALLGIPNTGVLKWSLVTAALTFGLLMTGSFMVGSDSTAACSGWPLCNNGLVDGGYHQVVALLHRYTAATVGVITLVIGIAVFRTSGSLPVQRLLAGSLVAIFIFQVLVGALTVLSDYSEFFQAFHLTMATAVWITLVMMVSHRYLSNKKLPEL